MILILILLLWWVGFLIFWRVPICRQSGDPDDALRISMIIPARNEEQNLERLLSSIRADAVQPFEVLVVDDGSQDGTAGVARSHGATVVEPGELPQGWRGKAWACHQGAGHARGQVFLFLDADTWLLPGAMARIRGEYRRRDVRALSVGPWHETQAAYEQLSAVFNLMTFMGLGAFGLWDSVERPKGLFGPFLMIDRAVYHSCGGHEAVRGEILEHMSLAPRLESEQIPMACLSGRATVHFQMYPKGLSELIQGWTKAFAAGASKTSPSRMALVVCWIIGSMMASLMLLLSPWIGPGGITPVMLYSAFVVQWGFFLWRVGRFSPWTALLFPIPLVFFFGLFGRSSWLRHSGRSVVWKGRSIG